MFNFLKKKTKKIEIHCHTDSIKIDNNNIVFPTNYNKLIEVFGEPSRELNNDKEYIYWDNYGIFCGCNDRNKILSICFFQNKKDRNKYNTKKQFTGELFYNDIKITTNDFETIFLGNVAIHPLGNHQERYGFSLGTSALLA